MKLDFKWFLVPAMVVAISHQGYGGFPAAAEEQLMHIEEKTVESTDPSIEVNFDQTYNDGTNQYQLSKVETQVIDSWPAAEAAKKEQSLEPFFDADLALAKEHLPAREIEEDGITYYLASSEIVSEVVEARTEYGKAEIRYDGLEYTDELPESEQVTVSDSLTGKEYSKELPRSRYQVVDERWTAGFSFDVKIYNYDADSYLLGTLEIPKGSDLTQYGQTFLSHLGLDPNYYRIDNIVLSGEPYEVDGELIQNAIASGTKRTVDVIAVYEGAINLPSAERYYYKCTYSSIPAGEEIATIYKIKATASYEQVIEAAHEVKPMSLWDQLIRFITTPVTLAVLLVLLFFIVFLMLIKRKKKKEESSMTYIKSDKKTE